MSQVAVKSFDGSSFLDRPVSTGFPIVLTFMNESDCRKESADGKPVPAMEAAPGELSFLGRYSIGVQGIKCTP